MMKFGHSKYIIYWMNFWLAPVTIPLRKYYLFQLYLAFIIILEVNMQVFETFISEAQLCFHPQDI